jgi:ABC-2 type transport system permease protein
MSRILVVATTEFLTLVRTKAFIIGLMMMPALIGLSIVFQLFAARQSDVDDHPFAVIDRTGALYDALASAAEAHNAKAIVDGVRKGPRFLPERVPEQPGAGDVSAVVLSDRVRHKSLFAFIDIPATVLDTTRTDADQISYYTETPSYTALPQWLDTTLEHEITARRFRASAIDPEAIGRLTRPTNLSTLGLFEQRADGTIVEARKVNQLQTFLLPFALMYLLFIALMTTAPQLLTAVVEEKMSRISEVLISSISPMQLLAGKLLGVSAISVLLALVYLGGGIYLSVTSGQFDLIRAPLVAWFFVYLLCAVLIYGAIFIAIGAMCSDLKDSQAMMQPVMIVLTLPLFMSPVVLRAPSSTLAVAASLFPTATPFLMLVRLALTPPPPLWQLALSVVLTVGTAIALVWAAGRVFRVGLLMQGKPPNLPELLRWIRQ